MINVCTRQAECKQAAQADKKQPSSYSYRTCLFFDKFVECLVLFLRALSEISRQGGGEVGILNLGSEIR